MTNYRRPRIDGAFELLFGGGLNERDEFNISPEECATGQNFLLDGARFTLKPRPPQDLEGTAPNNGAITGILQLIKRDDTFTQVLVADDTWYDWDGAEAYSDVTPPLFTSGTDGARMRGTVWALDDLLIITDLDKENLLYKWDGTTAARLKTNLASGNPQAVTTATCTGGTATLAVSTHGYSTGDLVVVEGANEAEYNGEFQITVLDAGTFTYSMTCTTSPATGSITVDLGIEVKAKYSAVFNSRVWLFNITADGTETPSMILASAFEDPEDYDNSTRGDAQGGTVGTSSDAFFLLAPDGRAINGVAVFYNTIVISTAEGKLFKLVGFDATDYAFEEYYQGSSAAGEEGIINVGDDVVFFRRGQTIESLSSTSRFGDVETDDLSLWIPLSVKLMSNPIAVYDQDEQKIYFFDDGLEGVLVLDKTYWRLGRQGEAGPLSPWSFYTTGMANKFSTKCAVQLRDPLSVDKTKTVFWGDSAGNVYNMNGSGTAGDGGSQVITMERRTKVIGAMNIRDELTIGRMEYKRQNATTVELTWNWSDEFHSETVSFNLKESLGLGDANFWGEADRYWSGVDYWGAGSVPADQVATVGFSVPGKGSKFFMEIKISSRLDYDISKIFV